MGKKVGSKIEHLVEVKILPIDWRATIPVRHRVLWPDRDVEFCHVDGDDEALHFGAYIDGKIVCVASVYIDETHARLRKFATIQRYQKHGIGTKMLDFILATLKTMDITYFWCDARKSAMDFYRKFGLKPEGEEFYKSDVPYYKMSKCL